MGPTWVGMAEKCNRGPVKLLGLGQASDSGGQSPNSLLLSPPSPSSRPLSSLSSCPSTFLPPHLYPVLLQRPWRTCECRSASPPSPCSPAPPLTPWQLWAGLSATLPAPWPGPPRSLSAECSPHGLDLHLSFGLSIQVSVLEGCSAPVNLKQPLLSRRSTTLPGFACFRAPSFLKALLCCLL